MRDNLLKNYVSDILKTVNDRCHFVFIQTSFVRYLLPLCLLIRFFLRRRYRYLKRDRCVCTKYPHFPTNNFVEEKTVNLTKHLELRTLIKEKYSTYFELYKKLTKWKKIEFFWTCSRYRFLKWYAKQKQLHSEYIWIYFCELKNRFGEKESEREHLAITTKSAF